MLEKVPRLGDVRRWLCLAAKHSQAGDNLDELSYPPQHPIAYGCRPRVQISWFETVLSYLVANPFLRKPLPPWAHML
jgi:hypothetical protein